MMKINIFRGDLTDISAKKEALIALTHKRLSYLDSITEAGLA